MNRLPAFAAVLLGLAVAGSAAQAQTVATAQGREGELSTARQIEAWLREAPPVAPPPPVRAASDPTSPWAEGLADSDGPAPLPWDAPPAARTLIDGKIHGEVGAEVGNRGYGGYAVASGPLGKDGYVQVGVSRYEATGRRARAYGDGSGQSLSLGVGWFPHRDEGPWRRPDTAAKPTPEN